MVDFGQPMEVVLMLVCLQKVKSCSKIKILCMENYVTLKVAESRTGKLRPE